MRQFIILKNENKSVNAIYIGQTIHLIYNQRIETTTVKILIIQLDLIFRYEDF
jgi:hypothetical protein